MGYSCSPPEQGQTLMALLKIRLLGGFDARWSSGTVLNLPTKKAQALLAYLATSSGQAEPRDKLAALLWGETSDHQARDSLRHALAALRKALAVAGADPPLLRIRGQHVSLDPDPVEVDVVIFERLVSHATPQSLEDAAELYRGDLLLGFGLSEPLFEDWLVGERERLREMALEALARLLDRESRTGHTERAIRAAVQLLALDPLQEAVHRALMQLHARQGRRGAALKQYQLCVDGLQRELGMEPETETKALYQSLLRHPAQVSDAGDLPVGDPSRPERGGGRPSLELPAVETPLFGRQADLARLQQWLVDVTLGRSHVATVLGEAGIGKTRLVSTLAAEAIAQGCRVLMGRCHESDVILPFAPWVDACRGGRLGLDEEVLGALHPARRAELARLLPEAGRPGLPRASDSPLPLFESLTQLLEQLAARQPLVLVLEDMHWADEMSLRLLSFVSRRLPLRPALLVVTAREEDLAAAALAQQTVGDLCHAPDATPMRLEPLSRADIGGIVRSLTRVGSDVTSLEAGIWAMSEGNPLVAVEAMRALAAKGPSQGGEGASELSLPERVRELIAQRLDRLSARSQAVAAVAAVIGRRFDFALLTAASGMDERHAAEAVEDMVRHHVLRSVGNEFEFTHDRVRDVAYGRLLAPRRRLLHVAVAEALEAAPVEDRPGEHIEQLAYHAVRGDLLERAVHYLRQAGEKAASRSALQHARVAFEQALGILRALPQNRSNLTHAFDIRLALRSVLVQQGELRQVLDVLREAEALAERLDECRLGHVYAFLTNIHARLDAPETALLSGARALEIAERLGDSKLRILATGYVEQAHYYRGEYARVIELATENLAALSPEWVHEFFGSNQPPSVNDRFRLVVSLAHLGRFAQAAQHEAETIALAEATHHAYPVAMAYHAAGTARLIKGDWARARVLIEREIAVLRDGNIGGELPIALANCARALAYLGHASDALGRCLEAERLIAEHSAKGWAGIGWTSYSLARAYFVLGRLDDANRLATLTIEAASARTDFVPDTLHLLGDIATHPERFDAERGEALYERALALAEAQGMRPLVAHCHLGLGKLRACQNRREQAIEQLDAAAAMYRDMDMRGWLQNAVAESSRIA